MPNLRCNSTSRGRNDTAGIGYREYEQATVKNSVAHSWCLSIQNPKPKIENALRRGPKGTSADDAGFTLVEIMIALAILGMSLFVLLEMHYNAVNAQARLENEIRVRNLLSLAAGMSEVEIAVGTLKDTQEFGDRYPGWRYAFDAQEVEASSTNSGRQTGSAPAFPGLYDVLVTIEDPDKTTYELRYYTVVKTFAGDQAAADDEEGEEGAEGEEGQSAGAAQLSSGSTE
ncbi:MAG: prepilin-type N-terminal cleavage/methylation domain-containing protein [Candidatus Hydrogenedentes bacterium]|nr:prepilin-type N-terminal cleavage/methylation domain-containing protein [Candidatus Hydrogenedentota bacterium]